MTVTETERIQPDTKEFVNETFFQSLSLLNNQLVKLEKEEITMKQFRSFVLEQRAWFAEQVIQYVHDQTLKASELEQTLLSIGKELLENGKDD